MTGRAAFFGKLPAHGDFVRRGDAALVRGLEAWLDAEIARRHAATGEVPVPPPYALAIGGGTGGAVIASRDAVGRAFPIVAVADRHDDGSVAAMLEAARDAGADADALHARLLGPAPASSITPDVPAADPAGWPDADALARLRAILADAGL